jgi:signal transduction histidine kinase
MPPPETATVPGAVPGLTNASPTGGSQTARLSSGARAWLAGSAVGGVLLLLAIVRVKGGYLLFHSLAEAFSVVVAVAVFLLAWNARRFLRDGYLLFIGIASLFVGIVDLIHMFAFKGMGVFPGAGADPPTQLWVSARAIQAVSLLVAPFLTLGGARTGVAMATVGAVSAGAVGAVAWRVFPACFVEGVGLTRFKIGAEYVICLVLAAALVVLWRRRGRLDADTYWRMTGSVIATIGSELAFTQYVSVYDSANLVGHLLKIVAFYLMYRAIVYNGVRRPFDVLFRDLKHSEEALRAARDHLDAKVRERTAELELEIAARERARRELDRERTRLSELLDVIPGFVMVVDEQLRVRFTNRYFLRSFGSGEGRRCHEVLLDSPVSCDPCPAREVLASGVPSDGEVRLPCGEIFDVRAYRFLDEDGSPRVLELGIDATERRLLEQGVLDASENERRMIGQELHDCLGQTLTGIHYLLTSLVRRLSADGSPRAGAAAEVSDQVRTALQQLRTLAWGLIPVELTASGLTSALTDLAIRTSGTFGIGCTIDGPPRIEVRDAVVACHLYRIAQEAVNNAVKHGGQTAVHITLIDDEAATVLQVDDSGPGFPPDLDQLKGSGLRSMQYRARTIGATFRTGASPTGGARVECRLSKRGALNPPAHAAASHLPAAGAGGDSAESAPGE